MKADVVRRNPRAISSCFGRLPRRALLVLTAVVLGGISAAPAAGANTSVGAVRAIDHGLTVRPPQRAAAQGKVRQPLFNLYALSTFAGQRASLGFRDGSVLHMNQRTDLVLRSVKLTVVRRGEISIQGRHTVSHQVQTPNAVAAAVGTIFDVRIEARAASSSYGTPTTQTFPPGTTTVSVVQGVVAVSNRFGSVRVLPGQWTHVRPGQAPTTPTRHNAAADLAWAAGLP